MNNDLFEVSMRIIAQPLVDERIALFDSFANTEHEFSKKFNKKIKRIFLADELRCGLRKSLVITKKVAVCLMIIITLTMVACMSIKSLRENIINAVITWYDEYFTLEYTQETSSEVSGDTYQTTEFTYIPEGYIVEEDISVNGYRKISYMNESGNYIYYLKQPYNDKADWYDSEGYDIEEISIGDLKAIFMYDSYGNKASVITWTNHNMIYRITAALPETEMIKIAESVK